ncbi:MAG: hypothetical protein QXE13_00020 [Sulfolobales archaeon]
MLNAQKILLGLKRIYIIVKPTLDLRVYRRGAYIMIGVATLLSILIVLPETMFAAWTYTAPLKMTLLTFTLILSYFLLNPLIRYIEFKRDLEEETPYLILLASSSPSSGDEIGYLMNKISEYSREYRIFTASRKIAVKARNLARFTGFTEALRLMSENILPGMLRKIMRNYLVNRSLGTQRVYLEILLEDIMRELDARYKRIISAKVSILTMILTVYTIVAIIVTTLSVIYGVYIVMYSETLMLAISLILSLIIPRHPMPMRIIRRSRIASLSGYISLSLLITPAVLILMGSGFKAISPVKEFVISNLGLYSLAILIASIPSVKLFVDILRELMLVRNLIIGSQSHVRVFKDLGNFNEDQKLKRSFRTWLSGYILFAMRFMREAGSIASDLYDKFCEKILELYSSYRNYMIHNLFSLIIVFMQPLLFSQVAGIIMNKEIIIDLSVIALISSSLVASKILFDELLNGFIGSLQLIFYLILMGGSLR